MQVTTVSGAPLITSLVCSGLSSTLFSVNASLLKVGKPLREAETPARKYAFTFTGTSSPTVSSCFGNSMRRKADWFLLSTAPEFGGCEKLGAGKCERDSGIVRCV